MNATSFSLTMKKVLTVIAKVILYAIFIAGILSFTAEAKTGISQLLWTGGWMLAVVLSAKGIERLGGLRD